MHEFLKFIMGMKFYMFRRVTVHHHELFIVHSAMVYVIQVCRQLSSRRIRMELCFEQDQDGTVFHPDPAARKLSTNLYDIYHRWVYSE
jgi:hypothetical protein